MRLQLRLEFSVGIILSIGSRLYVIFCRFMGTKCGPTDRGCADPPGEFEA